MSQTRIRANKTPLFEMVKRLRLQRGDVVVVRDPFIAERLAQMKWPYITFQVPIVVAPLGIEAIPAEELMKIAQSARETSRLIIPGKV